MVVNMVNTSTCLLLSYDCICMSTMVVNMVNTSTCLLSSYDCICMSTMVVNMVNTSTCLLLSYVTFCEDNCMFHNQISAFKCCNIFLCILTTQENIVHICVSFISLYMPAFWFECYLDNDRSSHFDKDAA